MRPLRGIGWPMLVIGASLVQGCASHSTPTLADRLVRPGKPSIEYADTSDTSSRRKPEPASAPKPAPGRTGVSPAMAGTMVENTDQRLAAALLFEATAPSVDSHLAVAHEYVRLRIFDAAEKRIERAIQLDPGRADAHESLARLWRDWGSPELAVGPAYRAIAAAPGSASAVNTLGTVFGALDDWEAAASRFAEASQRSPAAWSFSNWCYAEFRLGQLASARTHCERAVQIDGRSRTAHNNLGLVLAASGDVDGARAEFLEAGDTATAEYNTGIVRAALSDYELAADAFERAIAARPDFTAAKQRAHQARMKVLDKQK